MTACLGSVSWSPLSMAWQVTWVSECHSHALARPLTHSRGTRSLCGVPRVLLCLRAHPCKGSQVAEREQPFQQMCASVMCSLTSKHLLLVEIHLHTFSLPVCEAFFLSFSSLRSKTNPDVLSKFCSSFLNHDALFPFCVF